MQQSKQHQRTSVVSRIAPPEALASIDFSDKESLRIDISNDTDPDCTVITVEGPDMGGNLLISVSGAFASLGVEVVKASINTIEGRSRRHTCAHTLTSTHPSTRTLSLSHPTTHTFSLPPTHPHSLSLTHTHFSRVPSPGMVMDEFKVQRDGKKVRERGTQGSFQRGGD